MRIAFTLMELIVVVVLIGILAAAVAPFFQRDVLAEAAHQVASHLRYTKHLAMVDNTFNPNDPTWYKARWQIFFTNAKGADNHWAYTIFSDGAGHTGNPDISEVAINPLDSSKLLTGGYSGNLIIKYNAQRATNELNIGHEYGIDNVKFSGGCKVPKSRLRIAFDYYGRPIYDNQRLFDGMYTKKGKSMLVRKQCRITLFKGNETISIAIEPETGYIHIL